MKRNAIGRIVIYSLLILVLLGILLAGLGIKLYGVDHTVQSFVSEILTGNDEDQLKDGISYNGDNGAAQPNNMTSSSRAIVDAAKVNDLEIEWVAGSVTIAYGDVTDITIEESGNFSEDEAMVWNIQQDKLIIRFQKEKTKIVGFGINNIASKDLSVTLPQGWIGDEIDIEVVSANVDVRNLRARELDSENVSGKMVFTDCIVDDMSLDTVSGKVEFLGTLKKLSCESVSADCVLSLQDVPVDIDMETVSGDMTLVLQKDFGFTVRFSTASGEFTSDLPVTRTGKAYTHGDGKCRIEFSGTSGDFIIRSAV